MHKKNNINSTSCSCGRICGKKTAYSFIRLPDKRIGGLFYNVLQFTIVFILIFIISSTVYGSDKNQKGSENYIELRRMYEKWNSGLFGSRRLYRNRLQRLLVDMIGEEIRTGRDYNISLLEVFHKEHFSSDLYSFKWLQIHGEPDKASLKEFQEKGIDYIREVERKKYLFFLSGKIRKFRIAETRYGRTVHLYLESVTIAQELK